MNKHDGDEPADLLRASLERNRELRTAFNRAWPLLEPADLVGDLWSVPAYLRRCAPWLGDPVASRRQRRYDAAVATERERMARVVDDLLEAHTYDDGEGVLIMLHGQDMRDALVDEAGTAAR